MSQSEQAFVFDCRGKGLLGIIHQPREPRRTGVLIVVGGPQYRVGSHRQFVLLARHLADNGVAAMRFDYTGMGDSEGEERCFEEVGEDMGSAIAAFMDRVPGLDGVVVWGLCDAASAALLFAAEDQAIKGLVLLNPWVRSEQGEAKAYIKHYYVQRLFSRELWEKIFKGEFRFGQSLSSFTSLLKKILPTGRHGSAPAAERLPFQDRMCHGLQAFEKPVMIVLSGNQDYVADEFRDLTASSASWKRALNRDSIVTHEFSEANHTFSSRVWRDRLAGWTLDWVLAMDARDT